MAVKNVVFRLQAETGRLRKDLEDVKKQLNGINDNTEKIDKNFQGLNGTIRKVGVALGGLAVGRELLQFGNSAITAAADFETLQISFTTFLGSAEEANRVLADLESFSVSTPFTPEQVQNAGKALLAFGISVDDLEVSLRRIGDLSAGTGKDFNELAVIYGKARVQGTLFAEDINQLTEAGVPIIQEFAKQFGVTEAEVKKLGSEGKISFANLEQAFASLTNEGGQFFGLTENLSQSTTGRISTLSGEFTQLKRAIGEGLLPIFEFLVQVARDVIAVFSDFGGFIERNKTSVFVFTSAVGLLVGALTRSAQITAANRIASAAKNVVDRVSVVITRLRTAGVRQFAIVQRQATVAQKAATLATILGRNAVVLFNTALKANPIGLLITGLSLVAGFFVDFNSGAGEANENLEELNEQTVEYESAAKSVNTVQEETSKRTAEQAAELKQLIGQLKNTNKNTKERSELIETINNKYGTTLKNLKTEKAFVEQLDLAYQNFVDTLKQRIFLEVRQEELTRLITEQIKLEDKLSDKVGTQLGEAFGRNFAAGATTTFTLTEATEGLKKQSRSLTEIFQSIKDDPSLESYAQAFVDLDANQQKLFISTARNQEEFNKRQDKLNSERNEANSAAFNELQDLEESFVNESARLRDKEGNLIPIVDVEGLLLQLGGVDEAIKALEGDFEDFDLDLFLNPGGGGGPSKIKSILLDLRRELQKEIEETEKLDLSLVDPKSAEDEIVRLENIAEKAKEISDRRIDERIADAKKAGQLGTREAILFEAIRAEQTKQIEKKLQDDIKKIQERAEEERRQTLQEIGDVDIETKIFKQEEELRKLDDAKKKLEKDLSKASNIGDSRVIQDDIDLNVFKQQDALERIFKSQVEQIEKKREFELENEELTAEERILINKEADFEILKLRSQLNDSISELNTEQTKSKKKNEEEQKEVILEGIEEILEATVDLTNKLIDLQIEQTDQAISAQERRVQQAIELADKGNAELLQAEEERLRELNEKRAKFVRAQQALAAAELVINSIVAVSKAAAEGGAAAPFTIAATLIALAAGLVAAKSQAQAAAGGFASGGYTGDGGKFDPAGTVHKGEFVFTKEKTAKYRPLFEQIHKGRNPFLTEAINEKVVVVNNNGFDGKLDRIEKAIKKQDRLHLNIDKDGISAIVSKTNFKQNRIQSKVRK